MEERNIPGWPVFYTVTKCGRIFSTAQTGKKELSQSVGEGYSRVGICIKPRTGATKSVHRAVALAWLPNPDNLPFVCHKDDDKSNNHVDNLYWGNYKTNAKDAIRNNKTIKGSVVGCSKLTEGNVVWIRNNFVKGCSKRGSRAMARKFGVANGTMWYAIAGKTWKHVTPNKAINA